jgi:predicted dehydrogenase
MERRKARVGIIGCGFTGDRYMPSLLLYPELEIAGATDMNPDRASKFCQYFSLQHYSTLDTMLADDSIDIAINLTSSSSHYEVTRKCLEAGKHVYTEKPICPDFSKAEELVQLAAQKNRYLSSAPSSLLGETAQTLWRALRRNEIGKVRLVYAELDDGPLHLMEPHTWRSPSGSLYDYREELTVGVTAEHACYYMAWLAAFFGPAKSITSFSSCLWPDRPVSESETLNITTPDCSVACITMESGVVIRLTCGLVAPYTHVMKIVGDKGVLSVNECWNYNAPVYIDRYSIFKFKAESYPISRILTFLPNLRDSGSRIYPPVRKANFWKRQQRFRHDFTRGIADMWRAITEGRPSRLPTDFCLHINEISTAIQNAKCVPYKLKTSFQPLTPLSDAELEDLIPHKW